LFERGDLSTPGVGFIFPSLSPSSLGVWILLLGAGYHNRGKSVRLLLVLWPGRDGREAMTIAFPGYFFTSCGISSPVREESIVLSWENFFSLTNGHQAGLPVVHHRVHVITPTRGSRVLSGRKFFKCNASPSRLFVQLAVGGIGTETCSLSDFWLFSNGGEQG